MRFKAGDKEWLQNNLDATWDFVSALQEEGVASEKLDNGTTVFRNASTDLVMDFLTNYLFDEGSRLENRRKTLVQQYIQEESEAKTLRRWNISFFGLANEAQGTREVGPGLQVHKVRRSKLEDHTTTNAQIRALAAPLHRLNDLPVDNETRHQIIADAIAEIKKNETNKDAVIRAAHDKYAGNGTAHLAIYVIDKDSKAPAQAKRQTPSSRYASNKPPRVDLNAVDDIIGIAIFFPTSANPGSGVEYVTAVEADAETRAAYEAMDDEFDSAESVDDKRLKDEASDRT